MEQEMKQEGTIHLEILEQKIDHLQKTVNQVRRYFLISTIITVVIFVLPLIVMIFAIPYIINTYSNLYEGLI